MFGWSQSLRCFSGRLGLQPCLGSAAQLHYQRAGQRKKHINQLSALGRGRTKQLQHLGIIRAMLQKMASFDVIPFGRLSVDFALSDSALELRNADIGKLLNVELSKSPFALALQRASKQLVVLDRCPAW